MGSLKLFNQQTRRFVAAGALLFATLVPALVPAMVSAATITERSVKMSTTAKEAPGVSYTVNFKAAADNTGAFVVDFCDSAVIGTACTPPTGMDVIATPGTTSGHTVTRVAASTVKVVLSSAVSAGTAVSVDITGFTNPAAVGSFYARIVTFADDTNASKYTATDVDGTDGTHLDEGTVALSTTDNIGVTGSVLESMIFCASRTAIADSCGEGATLDAPSISLGNNGVLGNDVSDGTIYSQISTNAAGGAAVNLKSDATGCGGLKRAGAPTACDITPMTPAGTIAQSAAKFGLKLGTVDNGTGTIDVDHGYSTSDYYMNYVANDTAGVTSTYGDTVYDTHDAPVSNANIPLIFGANVGNDTPAGSYSATLSLIATGKF